MMSYLIIICPKSLPKIMAQKKNLPKVKLPIQVGNMLNIAHNHWYNPPRKLYLIIICPIHMTVWAKVTLGQVEVGYDHKLVLDAQLMKTTEGQPLQLCDLELIFKCQPSSTVFM